MACVVVGPVKWTGSQSKEGHREYKVTFKVYGETTDGPNAALFAYGMPLPGTHYVISLDLDLWAFATFEKSATAMISDEPGNWWLVEQTFSTIPPVRCNEQKIDDPLLEPID